MRKLQDQESIGRARKISLRPCHKTSLLLKCYPLYGFKQNELLASLLSLQGTPININRYTCYCEADITSPSLCWKLLKMMLKPFVFLVMIQTDLSSLPKRKNILAYYDTAFLILQGDKNVKVSFLHSMYWIITYKAFTQ